MKLTRNCFYSLVHKLLKHEYVLTIKFKVSGTGINFNPTTPQSVLNVETIASKCVIITIVIITRPKPPVSRQNPLAGRYFFCWAAFTRHFDVIINIYPAPSNRCQKPGTSVSFRASKIGDASFTTHTDNCCQSITTWLL